MKWVVLVIIVCLAGYTFVTLRYRKIAPPHEPYSDAKERFTATRVREAGYARIPVNVERPADLPYTEGGIPRPLAEVSEIPGGLPRELLENFAEAPKLPQAIGRVVAPATLRALFPYPIVYNCELPDHQDVLGDTRVYTKEQDIIIVTDFDRIDSDLLARTRDTTVSVSLPAHLFESGKTYTITLTGEKTSRQWQLQVH
jgi:hypothetical protein